MALRRWLRFGILLAIAGCNSPATSVGTWPTAVAAEGVAGVVAHTESAQRHVANAVPHADSTGKVHLGAASDEHEAILTDAAKARTALTAAEQQVHVLGDRVNQQQSDYRRLEERWYVVWGRRIEWALWIIGVSWLAAGVASIIFGLGNPLTWTWRIGKEITRLLPGMNIFSWIRDWILSRREQQEG